MPGTPATTTVSTDVELAADHHYTLDAVSRGLQTLLGAQTGRLPKSRAASWLGVGASEVMATVLSPGELRFWAIAARLRDLAAAHDGVEVDAEWNFVPIVGPEAVPAEGLALFPAGVLGDVPLAIELRTAIGDGRQFRIFTRKHDRAEAAAVLRALRDTHVHHGGPLSNKVIVLTGEYRTIHVDAIDRPSRTRDQVVVHAGVWDALDRNVDDVLRHSGRLREAGLPTSQGVLLAGPPGVGKSALVQVLISEAEGRATVLLPDADAIRLQIGAVYEYARALAPSMVVIEDIDLVVPNRNNVMSGQLQDLLNEMDGPRRDERPVVTVATTNAPLQLDEALRRARRFDEVVEVGLPDRDQRETQLRRLLANVDNTVEEQDVVRLARQLDGATGADIEDAVRHALLAASPAPVSGTHLYAAADLRPTGTTPVSTYL